MNPVKLKYNYKIMIVLIVAVSIILTITSNIIYENIELNKIALAVHGLMMTTIIWIGCTFIVRILWKYFPWEHKPLPHLILEITFIIGYTILVGHIAIWIQYKIDLTPYEMAENHSHEFVDLILITLLISTIHEAVFFYKQWKYNFSKSAKLQKDNIEAKYETLKTQINPHFLFNSLNSLSHIVEENQEATKYISNLSEFLRYVLKSRDRELVLLGDEIKTLQKYISIQKSRFRSNLNIQLNVDEKYFHYSLPPLVIQMLVENCIKHNILSKDKPLTIDIFIKDKCIVVQNNLQKKFTEFSTGLGLKNICERMSFFTNNEVEIQETKTMFKVSIPLLHVEL